VNPHLAQPAVSIVVACRNEIGHIRVLLDSILSQEMNEIPWEAILADGMSTDGTRELLEDYAVYHPQIRVIDNPERIVSTGLNRAIRAARGAIILRMDAHTCYAPDYCRTCIALLETTGADNVGGPARTRATGLRARAVAAAYHSRFSTGGACFHDVNYRGWADTVPYGCWRKSTLQSLGLFDETLVRNQDDELNLRLLRSGGRIWQDPDIRSWYSPRPNLRGLFRQYFQYGFWKVAVIRKHRLPASWRHLVPVLFVLANISLAAGTLLGLVTASPVLSHISGWTWLAMLVLYTVAVLTASLAAADREGWAILPYLPPVFAAYHFSYGLGFLFGLRWIINQPAFPAQLRPDRRDSVFTALTR
jgi:succinoglycan biosynthesis protein ExoA